MKRLFIYMTFASVLSCTSAEVPGGTDENHENIPELCTIYASTEIQPQQKNMIDDASFQTFWTSGDAINVFFGPVSSRFVTDESGAVAQFKGTIDVVTGGGEGLTDETSLWGIYPYNASNTCNGNSITLTLPATQSPAENTFADGLFPQIARSRNFYMTFYNLCACIRFTVSNSDIKSVTLSGNNNEPIAGKVRASLDKVPVVDQVMFPETKLTMNAPDGGYFKPGVNYYFVLFPTTFSNGLTMTYYKENAYASYTYSNAYTLARNKVSRFKERDAGLTFKSNPLTDWGDGEHIGGEI